MGVKAVDLEEKVMEEGMENVEQVEEQPLWDKKELSLFLDNAFRDLTRLSEIDKDVFFDLYYNRDKELKLFRDMAEHLGDNGNNILIAGNAGIGKSNFIFRLAHDECIEKYKLFPIIMDYRAIQGDTGSDMTLYKLAFIEKLASYFEQLAYNILLKENTVEHIYDNIHILQVGLENLPKERKTKHAVIFIDDLDYAEKDVLFNILEFLTPFARSVHISTVLAVRPPLKNAIMNNDFKYRLFFVNDASMIDLPHSLNIENIIAMRLSPLLVFPASHPIIVKVTPLKNDTSKYRRLLSRIGVRTLQDMKNIDYPFTENYITFMDQITDGNLREAFDIAVVSLEYISKNYRKLDDEIDKRGQKRKVIPRSEIIKLFSEKNQSAYKIFNLHSIKNKEGNSLYYNILEVIKYFGYTENFYEIMEKYGYKKDDVAEKLSLLSRRQNRFLFSDDFPYANDKVKSDIKYTLTAKADYYLTTVSKWDEYIKEYGKSKTSIFEKEKEYI